MNVVWDGITAEGFAVADIVIKFGDTVELEGPWCRISYTGPYPTGLVRLYRDLNPGRHARTWVSTYADREPTSLHEGHWTVTPLARP